MHAQAPVFLPLTPPYLYSRQDQIAAQRDMAPAEADALGHRIVALQAQTHTALARHAAMCARQQPLYEDIARVAAELRRVGVTVPTPQEAYAVCFHVCVLCAVCCELCFVCCYDRWLLNRVDHYNTYLQTLFSFLKTSLSLFSVHNTTKTKCGQSI